MKFIYLHGFASSPSSRKAAFFAAKLREAGQQVEVPHLEKEGFRRLTVTSQLNIIEDLLDDGPVRLIGSSMGGYLAALAMQRNSQIDRGVLLAPAFGFAERWERRLGAETMAHWREAGAIEMMHYATGRPEPIGYELIADGLQYPAEPRFPQAALVFHGVLDDVVPVEFSREFVAGSPSVSLIELHSGHELTDVMEEIWAGSRDFLLS
ncbi:MAG: alpha/beta fold hydrolase [Bryobacter sp.]|jgi:pimeloyl-ACP methyl ester carboxylesterase|nr:alpha/beta fold hydrolase [Bryobacter sp. CoA8 C33]